MLQQITLITQDTFTHPVTIRPARLTDANTVYDFICMLEETTIDRVNFYTVYRINLDNPAIYYFVADKAGAVVGFISCHTQYLLHHGGKVGEIQELFVRPDRRGQSIGQQLLAEVTTLAIQEGLVNLEVTTNKKRLDTIRFYERESFQLSHYKLVKSISP